MIQNSEIKFETGKGLTGEHVSPLTEALTLDDIQTCVPPISCCSRAVIICELVPTGVVGTTNVRASVGSEQNSRKLNFSSC